MSEDEVRLVDPEPEALADAVNGAGGSLVAGSTDADGNTYFDWPQEGLDVALGQYRNDPEGLVIWDSPGFTPQLTLAWTTTPDGRKRVRIVADAVPTLVPDFRVGETWHRWPADAIVFREHAWLYQAEPLARLETVLACDCGAVGRPREIGWTGERCGPCHDRLADGVPLPVPLRRHECRLGRVRAVSPDGRRAIVVGGDRDRGEARLVDLDTAAEWRTLPAGTTLRQAAFSAEGTRLGLAYQQGYEPRLRVHSYPGLEVVHEVALPVVPNSLALSPDGAAAYAAGCRPGGGQELWRVTLPGGRQRPLEWRRLGEEDSPWSVACSPEGRWLAWAQWHCEVVLASPPSVELAARGRSSDATHAGPTRSPALAFTPDGGTLLVVDAGRVSFLSVPSLASLGTLFTPLHCTGTAVVAGPWLAVLPESCPALFVPWQPLLEFVRAETGRGP